jgi:glycosyltransferase involved in cell wall biosynthesis
MLTVAYLANQFPSAVEPYVIFEIEELQKRGVQVVTGSVRKTRTQQEGATSRYAPEVVLQPLRGNVVMRAGWLFMRRWTRISPLIARVIFHGSEGPLQRAKALAHTWLGACYAVLLERHTVDHIHVHHGYFGSWIAMVASKLLGTGFSMTLHGSDLLLHGAYLDLKLDSCTFCLTVSDYNRRYILDRYPTVDPAKVVVARLGVDVSEHKIPTTRKPKAAADEFALLAVGRLHAVKDHAFLVRACAQLHARDMHFHCLIAGEGPERRKLERMIQRSGLEERVTLLGHARREQMGSLYEQAGLVVLTSRSEGIPLVLMEAMARRKIVLAPAITGIPELVTAGKTGFLYEPGSMGDFLAQLLFIHSLIQTAHLPRPHPNTPPAARRLDWIGHAARVQVRHNFNRTKNLESFVDLFIARINPRTEGIPHENFVLQQIQLPVQRNRGVPV